MRKRHFYFSEGKWHCCKIDGNGCYYFIATGPTVGGANHVFNLKLRLAEREKLARARRRLIRKQSQ